MTSSQWGPVPTERVTIGKKIPGVTLGRTQGHQEDLRKSKNTQNTSQLDMQKSRETARKKTIEDMMKTEKEKEAQAQEDIEEEIIAQEMIVTVIDQQEEEDT